MQLDLFCFRKGGQAFHGILRRGDQIHFNDVFGPGQEGVKSVGDDRCPHGAFLRGRQQGFGGDLIGNFFHQFLPAVGGVDQAFPYFGIDIFEEIFCDCLFFFFF